MNSEAVNENTRKILKQGEIFNYSAVNSDCWKTRTETVFWFTVEKFRNYRNNEQRCNLHVWPFCKSSHSFRFFHFSLTKFAVHRQFLELFILLIVNNLISIKISPDSDIITKLFHSAIFENALSAISFCLWLSRLKGYLRKSSRVGIPHCAIKFMSESTFVCGFVVRQTRYEKK